MGSHYVFSTCYIETFAYLIPLLFRRLWPPLSPRIAIVFSLLSSVPNFSMPHSSIFLISQHILFFLVYFTSSHYVSSIIYCFSTRAHLSVLFPPPSPDYWHASFFFLAGPGPLHEIAVSAFSRSPLGRANTFSFLFLLLPPRKSFKCSSSFTLFLSASLSLIFIFSFTSVFYPANFSMDRKISSWFPPISFHIFSTMLSRLIPASPFVAFSHTALSAMAANLFFGMFLALYCHFDFLTSLFVLSG